jgi:hypothetical protein
MGASGARLQAHQAQAGYELIGPICYGGLMVLQPLLVLKPQPAQWLPPKLVVRRTRARV